MRSLFLISIFNQNVCHSMGDIEFNLSMAELVSVEEPTVIELVQVKLPVILPPLKGK